MGRLHHSRNRASADSVFAIFDEGFVSGRYQSADCLFGFSGQHGIELFHVRILEFAHGGISANRSQYDNFDVHEHRQRLPADRTPFDSKKLLCLSCGYAGVHPCGKLSTAIKAEIKEKVSGLMLQKLCYVSRNAFDSIFISAFLGLTEIAIYNNYYYIMNAITGFMGIATSAVLAGVGNSVATETKEKNHQDMMRMNFVYMWISGWFTVCLLCLYQPFMRVWVGSEMLLPMSSVVLLCAYFYTLKMGDVKYVYSSASGLWWQNRYRTLAEAVVNIVLNYVLGKYYGINGIIAATLISLFFIGFGYGSLIIYQHYFTEQKPSVYYAFHASFAMATVITCAVCWLICRYIPDTLLGFVGRVFICIFIPNIILYLLFNRTEMYHDTMLWLLKRIGKKYYGKGKRIMIIKRLLPWIMKRKRK